MTRRFLILFAFLCLAGLIPAASLPAQQTYVLTDITAWTPEGDTSLAHINASGQVAGYTVDASGAIRSYLWTPTSAHAATGSLSFLPLSEACAINGTGQVAGYGNVTLKGKKTAQYAQIWQPNGTLTNLLSGAKAFGLNDTGQAVGEAFATVDYPFLWSNGTAYNLAPQTGGLRATGINRNGQVTGLNADFATGFLWTPNLANGTTGTSLRLPFAAAAINDLGQVAGPPSTIAGQAAVYTGAGGVQYLNAANASGINNLTQVVGAGQNGAYLWDSAHGLRYLNDPLWFTINNASGWSFQQAESINDYGQIVGWGTNAAGVRRIFLLTPL